MNTFDDHPPVGYCNRCGRLTWNTDNVGSEDRMTQPDGNPCGGQFKPGTGSEDRMLRPDAETR